ncbi:sensor histidine kinase [uncultured Roseobacter sp.]|uniref:sensor histidine kinase n=1 Tax=uncultured Roseobacter sp. TaxID=114847 RepID=UPI00261F3A33|nr:sensor histidine kinase [uncultured Roseobacter sp.]
MNRSISLRVRLTAIILLPLMTLAVLAGLWQLGNARRTAAEVFDRGLLSAALAVANDVAISEGDALSPRTSDILESTSGGPVFYHVYAPDGVIVAGYATPPVGIPTDRSEAARPAYFNAMYLGRSVSGVRVQNRTEIDGFAGIFTTTVWQDSALRAAFVRDLVMRSFIAISTLILSLGLIVWFGVRLGLRPLLDLENAIGARSGSDLSPIRRAVPTEVGGIVATLNRLLGQVSQTMAAQSEFIGNAAHQLRNPIAGVLSLAEAVVAASDKRQATARAGDLLEATRHLADLSQKLLMLERAESLTPQAAFEEIDLGAELAGWVEAAKAGMPPGVTLSWEADKDNPWVTGDVTMLREALSNLVDNALLHAGPDLTTIRVSVRREDGQTVLSVHDNGRGLSEQDLSRAMQRFVQVSETSVNGLGLSIAEAVAKGHGGEFRLSTSGGGGLTASLHLPTRGAG